MKYTIQGFSQKIALTFRKNIFSKGKEREIKIDCTDLTILRWFVDFYPTTKKMFVDGKEYMWLNHKKLREDLPILDITNKSCIERMQKLVEFEILEYTCLKEGGTFSLYRFGKNYYKLISDKKDGSVSTAYGVDGQSDTGCNVDRIGGGWSTAYGVDGQPHNKDISIKDTTIKDMSIRERKKESNSASGTFDEILSEINNADLRDLFLEYIKMRKLIKAPLTDRALKIVIKKVFDLEPYDIDRQKQLLENAISNNWKSVYPIKDDKEPNNAGSKSNYDNGNIFYEIAKEQNLF